MGSLLICCRVVVRCVVLVCCYVVLLLWFGVVDLFVLMCCVWPCCRDVVVV